MTNKTKGCKIKTNKDYYCPYCKEYFRLKLTLKNHRCSFKKKWKKI